MLQIFDTLAQLTEQVGELQHRVQTLESEVRVLRGDSAPAAEASYSGGA